MRGQRFRDGAPWEEEVGYSRAVRVGERVLVSGTAPVDDNGDVVAPKEPYEQARQAMELIVDALGELDARAADVVRTRMYVRDADDWPEVGRAHREFFGDASPATTLVEVEGFVDGEIDVEVEAEAIVRQG